MCRWTHRIPSERLAFMLDDTRAPIAADPGVACWNDSRPPKRQAFCLDSDWRMIAQESAKNPDIPALPENPLYLLYTSGSTGTPKGVVMGHRPICNLIAWQLQDSRLPPGSKTVQFASLNFDVSFQEIFSTWCSGGTLLLISDDLRRDPSALLQLISEESAERLFLPFVALEGLVEAADEAHWVPISLREVITAGEQLRVTPAMVRVFAKLDGCPLHNHYGPTESHVVTAFALTGPPEHWPELPPIGRPDCEHADLPAGPPTAPRSPGSGRRVAMSEGTVWRVVTTIGLT